MADSIHGRDSLVAQKVKNLPAMRETWVQSQGWEDPRRRAWQPSPVFLPGEALWTKGAWRATVHGVTKSWTQLSIDSEKERDWCGLSVWDSHVMNTLQIPI